MAELIITKNGEMIARTTAEATEEDVFAVVKFDSIPEYPTESAGAGMFWGLEYKDNALSWIAKARPLNQNERLTQLENQMNEVKFAWVVGEAVKIGDKRFYSGVWYECIQAHTTQEGWQPPSVAALWKAV